MFCTTGSRLTVFLASQVSCLYYYRWWPTGTGKSSYTLQCMWFVSQVFVCSSSHRPFDWLYNQVKPLILIFKMYYELGTVVVIVREIPALGFDISNTKDAKVWRIPAIYELRYKKMTLLSMRFHSSVYRVPAWCSGGHGFNSCWGFFLCPMLVSCLFRNYKNYEKVFYVQLGTRNIRHKKETLRQSREVLYNVWSFSQWQIPGYKEHKVNEGIIQKVLLIRIVFLHT